MAERLTLMGFGPSVYARIARMALIELDLSADYVEVNPFAETPDPALTDVNPIGRVPVLKHGDFILSETAAILRYLDNLSLLPSLIPECPKSAARMQQIIGIVDAHLYVPLVREAFGHGVFRPREGAPFDPDLVAAGVAQSLLALSLLERIATEGHQLDGETFSLADLHLMPMMAYGFQVPQVLEEMRRFPVLSGWWETIRARPSLLQTDPLA